MTGRSPRWRTADAARDQALGRVADQRKDGIHKLTTDLASTYVTVVVEDLHVRGMLADHRPARHVADASFAQIRRQLTDRTAWHGGTLNLWALICNGRKRDSAAGNDPGRSCADRGMDVDVTGPASPLLAVPGAVPDTGRDVGTVWHYGDPMREQRLLAAGSAVTDLSHRGVVRVAGPDRLGWLHSLTTQHLSGLASGVSTESLVLSPHGHIEHALHLIDDGAAVWITVEPGTSGELVAWLEKMRFLLRVEVSNETASWAAVGLTGVPGAWADGLDDAPPAWRDPWPAVAPGSVSYAEIPDDEHPGTERLWREVLVPRAELADRLAGTPLAGSWAAEALRVAAWRPRFGAETDHRTIPHEVDWLRTAVHLTKGCYRGQETIARVHNLGRPPRRLVLLHLDGSEHTLPEPGEAVHLGPRAVGHLTTAARHHELGPIALALVKRSVAPDAQLTVAGLAAAPEIVVRP